MNIESEQMPDKVQQLRERLANENSENLKAIDVNQLSVTDLLYYEKIADAYDTYEKSKDKDALKTFVENFDFNKFMQAKHEITESGEKPSSRIKLYDFLTQRVQALRGRQELHDLGL